MLEFLNVQTGLLNVPELLIHVAVAIAIGGLIGLEREKEDKFAGVRTLSLLSGSAPLVIELANHAGLPVIVAVYLLLVSALALAIAYIRFNLRGDEIGFTTTVVVFQVGVLGLLVGYGLLFEATAVAIVTAFLLAEKERILQYVDRLSYEELSDSMKLGALLFILYPVLPTEPVDPYGVVNLREVLVFAIFVLLIQFAAFVSMRQFGGSKGLQVTGVLAGGANSLATAGVMARMANQSRDAVSSASSALLLATGSMILRNIAIASALAIPVIWVIWPPAAGMLGLTLVVAYLLAFRGETSEDFDIDLESPFSFRAAAKFAVMYIAILVVSVAAEEFAGEFGLYATSFAGGLVSSAAVAVSAATVYNSGSFGAEPAAGMVIIGIVASLAAKIALIEAVNTDMRTKASVPMAVVGLLGLGVFLLM